MLVELEIVFCIGRTYRGLDLFSSGVVLLAQLFSSSPLDQQRFQVLAQPLREGGWKLLVLEQLKPSPACWRVRSDGLVSPSLVRFDFSGWVVVLGLVPSYLEVALDLVFFLQTRYRLL